MSKTLFFKEGEVVLKEGELSFEAYIIESGVARVTKSVPENLDGEEEEDIVLADLKEDEIFGEMGWLDRSPRSATVTAKTRLAIRVLKEEDAVQFMTHNPKALLPILRVLGSRLRETIRLIEKFTGVKKWHQS